MPTNARNWDVRPLSRFLKALADETRIRIVALLSQRELCVYHLVQALRLSQPNVSRHLGILRAAGVVDARRDASWVYYRVAPQSDRDCREVLRALTSQFATRAALRRDVARALRAVRPVAGR